MYHDTCSLAGPSRLPSSTGESLYHAPELKKKRRRRRRPTPPLEHHLFAPPNHRAQARIKPTSWPKSCAALKSEYLCRHPLPSHPTALPRIAGRQTPHQSLRVNLTHHFILPTPSSPHIIPSANLTHLALHHSHSPISSTLLIALSSRDPQRPCRISATTFLSFQRTNPLPPSFGLCKSSFSRRVLRISSSLLKHGAYWALLAKNGFQASRLVPSFRWEMLSAKRRRPLSCALRRQWRCASRR
jgi:hypothetical protein